jgi:hypothetical protein
MLSAGTSESSWWIVAMPAATAAAGLAKRTGRPSSRISPLYSA